MPSWGDCRTIVSIDYEAVCRTIVPIVLKAVGTTALRCFFKRLGQPLYYLYTKFEFKGALIRKQKCLQFGLQCLQVLGCGGDGGHKPFPPIDGADQFPNCGIRFMVYDTLFFL